MRQNNLKFSTRRVNFGMLLLSAAVMIFTVRLTYASDLDSLIASAEQGDVGAQFKLGKMYDFGEGVTENDTEAVRWYRMASEQGGLGSIFEAGLGIPKDYIHSLCLV